MARQSSGKSGESIKKWRFRQSVFFRRILIIFISLSFIPVIFSSFLIISTYQNVMVKLESRGFLVGGELEALKQNIWIQILLILFLLIVLIVFFSVLIARSITNPLSALSRGAEAVSRGNLDIKFNIKSKDELGFLAGVLNKMIRDLKKSHLIQEESKMVLEIKVKARTRELEELAQTLEDKVKERTKELQKKIDELERFRRLTVGRELKMIELKKEIKKLEDKKKKNIDINN
jgi:nitrate/nitrite-specific signal transduction histidine kinase